jgi:hypothetical protein
MVGGQSRLEKDHSASASERQIIIFQAQGGGSDPCILRLDDGRYRLYYAEAIDEGSGFWGIISWISNDGSSFIRENGYG